MPLFLIRQPAFLAHLRGLDSISPTVLPAHTFILSKSIPVKPPLKVITQRYPQFISLDAVDVATLIADGFAALLPSVVTPLGLDVKPADPLLHH